MARNNDGILVNRAYKYFELLQGIEKLLNSVSNSGDSHDMTKHICDKEEQSKIVFALTDNLSETLQKMTTQRRSMFIITVLSIVLRICALDVEAEITRQINFRWMSDTLVAYVWHLQRPRYRVNNYREYATNMLDFILMNLTNDGLLELCRTRLLPENATDVKSK